MDLSLFLSLREEDLTMITGDQAVREMDSYLSRGAIVLFFLSVSITAGSYFGGV